MPAMFRKQQAPIALHGLGSALSCRFRDGSLHPRGSMHGLLCGTHWDRAPVSAPQSLTSSCQFSVRYDEYGYTASKQTFSVCLRHVQSMLTHVYGLKHCFYVRIYLFINLCPYFSFIPRVPSIKSLQCNGNVIVAVLCQWKETIRKKVLQDELKHGPIEFHVTAVSIFTDSLQIFPPKIDFMKIRCCR